MLFVTQTALELGFQYALVAMALFLSYRVLDIADLTTDGCFILGCAVSVSLTAAGHPFLAIPAAMAAGACAGFVTAFLQTKLGVESILAGIIVNTGLYTVNLAVMGWSSNLSIYGSDSLLSLCKGLFPWEWWAKWHELAVLAVILLVVALLVVLACFFSKEHLITREGVDIQYTLFGKVSHNLWRWEEVTAIHVDRKRSMPNVALHIGKDVAIRLFVFTPKDAQAVLDLAKERNPAIQLGRVAGS